MRRQASWVVASGFSQKTGLPAAIDASTYCSWDGPHEQTTTASTAGSAINSSPLVCRTACGSPSATFLAVSMSTSVTAVTVTHASTVVIHRMWSWPIIPVPMTPTRNTLMALFLDRKRRPESAAELVGQLGQLVSAGHLGGQLVQADLGTLLVQDRSAELEDDE